MPECSYCRQIFPGVGLGGDDHNWLTCANNRIAELEKELDDLKEGRTAILPKTREHALKLLTVAEACVRGNAHVQPL